MTWNPSFAVVILFITLISFAGGIAIDKFQNNKRGILVFCILIILGTLIWFKYINFLIETTSSLLGYMKITIKTRKYDILLPVGISYYTFSTISYLIDIYKNKLKTEYNFINFALFVSFFPHLIAGPIDRADKLLPQFYELKKFNYEEAKRGFLIMIWGYFQKLVIADRAAIFVDSIFENITEYKGIMLISAIFLYTIQIYCDFSGYSDIARGAAKILGYDIAINFKRPYFALSIKDFWNRWHLSLTSWLRDYLYIPLGGNRKGEIRKNINIIVVFLISGLWHGSNITFVIWGAVHGVLRVIENLLVPVSAFLCKKLRIKRETESIKILKWFLCFCCINLAWVFFRANSISDALYFYKNMFSFSGEKAFGIIQVIDKMTKPEFCIITVSMLMLIFISAIRSRISIYELINRQNLIFRWLIYYIAIFIILIFGIYGPNYNSADFIYYKF